MQCHCLTWHTSTLQQCPLSLVRGHPNSVPMAGFWGKKREGFINSSSTATLLWISKRHCNSIEGILLPPTTKRLACKLNWSTQLVLQSSSIGAVLAVTLCSERIEGARRFSRDDNTCARNLQFVANMTLQPAFKDDFEHRMGASIP